MAGLRRSFDALMDRRAAAIPRLELTREVRLALVKQHGDFSLAYSTAVQDGLSYFGDGEAYIAFGAKMGSVIALGDPVAEAGRRAELIDGFIAAAGRPCFAEISEETAKTLSTRGYRIARMGIDTALDLQSYDFSGKRKETVRYSERWLDKNGFRMVEDHEIPGAEEGIAALSAKWRASRIVKRREMAFLNRPFPKERDPLMRRFLLVAPDGSVQALLYFDPLFSDGRVTGYLTSFKRKLPETTSHAEIGLTKRAVDTFRAEGLSTVMLGLSPLASPGRSGFEESAAFRWTLEKFYGNEAVNRKIFNLKGHAAFKRRFHGREVPRYFAWGRGSAFVHFISMLRLSKAF